MPVCALTGCYVISLRPVAGHAALRRAAARHGARLLALSPWKLQHRDDPATRRDLQAALACGHVLFTSPAAVRAARALQALHPRDGQQLLAVGAATARALGRAGIPVVASPARMDSEGVLAMAELDDVSGRRVGLVTAPGGRDLLQSVLRARGASIARADVYARVPVAVSARAIAALRAMDATAWLAVSSGQGLDRVLHGLPGDVRGRLLGLRVVVTSERLAALVHARGFERVVVADGPLPRQLLATASASMAAGSDPTSPSPP